MPSRRGFLGVLGATVASATLDPERLLWVPGAKVYSLPSMPLPGAMVRFKNLGMFASHFASGMAFPAREFYEFAGQRVFPELRRDHIPTGDHIAYLLPTDWNKLVKRPGFSFESTFSREVVI